MNPNTPLLFWIMAGSAYLLGLVIFLLIAWAIIRGAVLSALRKHYKETHSSAPRTGTITQVAQGQPAPAQYRYDQ